MLAALYFWMFVTMIQQVRSACAIVENKHIKT